MAYMSLLCAFLCREMAAVIEKLVAAITEAKEAAANMEKKKADKVGLMRAGMRVGKQGRMTVRLPPRQSCQRSRGAEGINGGVPSTRSRGIVHHSLNGTSGCVLYCSPLMSEQHAMWPVAVG